MGMGMVKSGDDIVSLIMISLDKGVTVHHVTFHVTGLSSCR